MQERPTLTPSSNDTAPKQGKTHMTGMTRIAILGAGSAVLLASAVTTGPVVSADPRPSNPPAACLVRQPAPYDTTGFTPGRIGAAWPGLTAGRNGKAVVFAAVATTSGGTLGFIPLATNGQQLTTKLETSSQAKVKPDATLLIDVQPAALTEFKAGEHVTVTLGRSGQGWQVERMTSIRCIT